jgi:GNAT superfamily N-acetyltransferase
MTLTDAPTLIIEKANYRCDRDAEDLVHLLDSYACDPMGGGETLGEEVREILVERLAEVPGAFSLLARLDGKAVGLANCFTQFSTFVASPVINIHDVVVLDGHRGRGIGRALMGRVEIEARSRGACKITLEVLSGNQRAKDLYSKLGYGEYVLDPAAGQALFWEKKRG